MEDPIPILRDSLDEKLRDTLLDVIEVLRKLPLDARTKYIVERAFKRIAPVLLLALLASGCALPFTYAFYRNETSLRSGSNLVERIEVGPQDFCFNTPGPRNAFGIRCDCRPREGVYYACDR